MADLPDYTRQIVIRYEGGFIGLEELAARLGSIVPWDLRGNVLLIEDFSTEETEWTLATGGTGSTATRVTTHKHSGDWSIELVAGDEADAYASATRYLHYLPAGKYAICYLVGTDKNLTRWALDARQTKSGGVLSTLIGVRLSSGGALQVQTGETTWTTVATVTEPDSSAFIFHSVVVTFDLENGVYDKLYYDGVEYDISSYSLYSSGESELYFEISMYAYAVGDTGCTIYFDSVVLAQNVP